MKDYLEPVSSEHLLFSATTVVQKSVNQ